MRARFWINEVTRTVSGKKDDGSPAFMGKVVATAVQRETDDNIDWKFYSPSGKLELNVNEQALAWFTQHQGQDIYLDMTVVDTQAEVVDPAVASA